MNEEIDEQSEVEPIDKLGQEILDRLKSSTEEWTNRATSQTSLQEKAERLLIESGYIEARLSPAQQTRLSADGVAALEEFPDYSLRDAQLFLEYIRAGMYASRPLIGSELDASKVRPRLTSPFPVDCDDKSDDTPKKHAIRIPLSPDILEMCRHLKKNRDNFPSERECAREFGRLNGLTVDKSINLLRGAKRYQGELW